MLLTHDFMIGALVYTALGFGIAGFLARDEFWLRLLMLIASGFYIAYYYVVTGMPLWDPIITNGLLALANVTVLCIVIAERSRLFMSREMSDIFARFSRLTPGQFRRLMRAGRIVSTNEPVTLASEGKLLDQLFFVLDGAVAIKKQGSTARLSGGVFIGEVAFLNKQPASATVQLSPGARYLVWDSADLERLIDRAPALGNALLAQLNVDMATKVGNSQPVMS